MALRIIQVGISARDRTWTPIVRQARDAVLVAYVDPNPKTLSTAHIEQDIPPAQYFSSLEAALASVEADAVLITAGAAAHAPVALAALSAGKHILLEKPFATTLTEAERIVTAATAAKRVLMISQHYRFYPAPRTVTALVRSSTLGAVGSVTIDFRQNAAALLPSEHPLYTMPQPLLTEIAVHHFDLLRMILGDEATHVSCQTWNPPWSSLTGPAAAVATITCADGAIVSYRGNWASHAPPTPWAGAWRIECADGEIAWTSHNGHDTSGDVVIVRRRGQAPRRVVLPQLQQVGRVACLSAFIRAVRTGQSPECSGRDNLGTIALLQSAIAAARSRQLVALPQAQADLPPPCRRRDWISRMRVTSASQSA